MGSIINIIGKINLIAGRWASRLNLVITVFVLWEILARHLFNAPTSWSNEVNQYLLCAMVMIGGGYTLKHRAHTRVDIVYVHFRKTRKQLVEIFIGFIVLFFCSPIIYYGIIIAHEAYVTGETSVSAAQLVLWPSQALAPLGALMLALQGLANALEASMGLFGKIPVQGEVR